MRRPSRTFTWVASRQRLGHHRYRCCDCGCNVTDTPRRGKSAAIKALAALPCAMGNARYGMPARRFGGSEVAVFKWIPREATALPNPATPAEVEIAQQGEMRRFVD